MHFISIVDIVDEVDVGGFLGVNHRSSAPSAKEGQKISALPASGCTRRPSKACHKPSRSSRNAWNMRNRSENSWKSAEKSLNVERFSKRPRPFESSHSLTPATRRSDFGGLRRPQLRLETAPNGPCSTENHSFSHVFTHFRPCSTKIFQKPM